MDVRTGAAPLSTLATAASEAKEVGTAIVSSGNGSPAAIALAAVAVGGILAVKGAQYEYNRHKIEQKNCQVTRVMEIYKKHLVDIPGTGFRETVTLPPPFILDKEEKASSAQALKLNEAIRMDLVNDKSLTTDPSLLQYGEFVKMAKQAVVSFYDSRLSEQDRTWFTRGSPDDVTSSVLTYILVMLNEHCTQFQGYQADLIYLKRIALFINGFASMSRDVTKSDDRVKEQAKKKNVKNRSRFEQLIPACKYLEQAYKYLLEHSSTRTLKSYVDQLMSVCHKTYLPELLKLYAKFITPEDHWPYIDNVNLEQLSTGVLRLAHDNTHTILHQKQGAVVIPDSIFKHWLQNIAEKHLHPDESISVSMALNQADLKGLRAFFQACRNFFTLKSPQPNAKGEIVGKEFVTVGFDTECYVRILSAIPSILEPDSFLLIRDGHTWKLYEIATNRARVEIAIADVPGLDAALKGLPNKPLERLTLHEKEKVNHALTQYRNDVQLLARGKSLLDQAIFIDLVCDVKIFNAKFSECISLLGLIYTTNPQHCNLIFHALNALCKRVSDQVTALLQAMRQIQSEQTGPGDMLIDDEISVVFMLDSMLRTVRDETRKNIDAALAAHYGHNEVQPKVKGKIDCASYDRDKKKQAMQGMLLLTTQMIEKHKIDTTDYDLGQMRETLSKLSLSDSESKGEEKHSEPSTPPHLPIAPVPHVSPLEEKHPVAATPVVVVSGPVFVPAVEPRPISLLLQIHARLENIRNSGEKPDQQLATAYRRMYQSLDHLDTKVKLMEKEPEPARKQKANQLKKLTQDLCQDTLEFLNLDIAPRLQKADPSKADNFVDQLRQRITATRQNFLDEHKSLFDRFLQAAKEVAYCLLLGYGFYRAHQRGGFFQTDSRAMAHEVGQSSLALSRSLVRPQAGG